MPKKIVIIQARMRSTRLYGKVMKKVCNKTILEHDILRISKSKTIDEIVIATTDHPVDDIIVEQANKLQVKFFRGNEHNVLSRYYFAALDNNADIIVRITSDCPLYDWQVLDNMMGYFETHNFDYLSNSLERTYPRGLETEIFTFNSLEKAYFEAKTDSEQEHVTPYIWQNPNLFKLQNWQAKINNSHHRWTLDTEEDFALISTIYNHLYPKNNYFTTDDILGLFEAIPNLFQINSHIEQKKTLDMKVLFRTDSSKQIGTGHVIRCLNLAQKLRSYGHEAKFVCRDLEYNIINSIINHGFKVFLLKKDKLNRENNDELFHNSWLETSWENDAQETINVLDEYQADWVVVDHYAIDYKWENMVRGAANAKIFVIDDLADRRHNCEAILDQNVLLAQDIQYKDLIPKNCKKFLGPEYALIKEDFWIERKANLLNNTAFIFFGGIDLPGATLKVLQVLININFTGAVNVVCGSPNPKIKDIQEVCRNNKNFKLFINTNNVANIISNCSFGIAAGGVNIWERCALALPTLVFSIAPNQEKISQDCEKANLCRYAGPIEKLSQDRIKDFIENKSQHQSIAASCLMKFKNSKINYLLTELNFI